MAGPVTGIGAGAFPAVILFLDMRWVLVEYKPEIPDQKAMILERVAADLSATATHHQAEMVQAGAIAARK